MSHEPPHEHQSCAPWAVRGSGGERTELHDDEGPPAAALHAPQHVCSPPSAPQVAAAVAGEWCSRQREAVGRGGAVLRIALGCLAQAAQRSRSAWRGAGCWLGEARGGRTDVLGVLVIDGRKEAVDFRHISCSRACHGHTYLGWLS
jgi:hypothetical protein